MFFQLYRKSKEEFFHDPGQVFFFYQGWGKLTFYPISSQKALWKKGVALIQDRRKENVAAWMLWGRVGGASEEHMWETGLGLQPVWTGTNAEQYDPETLVG